MKNDDDAIMAHQFPWDCPSSRKKCFAPWLFQFQRKNPTCLHPPSRHCAFFGQKESVWSQKITPWWHVVFLSERKATTWPSRFYSFFALFTATFSHSLVSECTLRVFWDTPRLRVSVRSWDRVSKNFSSKKRARFDHFKRKEQELKKWQPSQRTPKIAP